MSRTYGHTKRQHFGRAAYRTAKPWRTGYNQALRRYNKVILSTNSENPDIIFAIRDEIKDGSLYDHPGD